MRKSITMISLLMLAACGGSDNSTIGGGGSTFKATVGSRDFAATVRCEDIGDVNEFSFSDYQGKNPGDINVSGLLSSNQTLLLTVHETTAEGYLDISAEFDEFEITSSGASGSGMSDSLVKDKSGTKPNDNREPVTFEVACN